MAGRTSKLITAMIMNATSETSTTTMADEGGTTMSDGNFIFDDYPQRVAVAVITLVVSFAGIVGNVLVLFAVSLSRKLQTKVNVFVVNLSVADGIISMVLPFSVVALLSVEGWPMPDYVCSIASGMLWISLGAGTVTLALIAFNRCYVIKQYDFDKAFTSRRIAAMIAFAWLYPGILIILSTRLGLGRLGYSYKYKSCLQDSTHPLSEYLSLFAGIVIFIPCLVVIISCYIMIFLHVRKHNRHLLRLFITGSGAAHGKDSFVSSSVESNSIYHSQFQPQRLPSKTQVHFNSNHTAAVTLADDSFHNTIIGSVPSAASPDYESFRLSLPSSPLDGDHGDESRPSQTKTMISASSSLPCPSVSLSPSAVVYPESPSAMNGVELDEVDIGPRVSKTTSEDRISSSSTLVCPNSSREMNDVHLEVFDETGEQSFKSSSEGSDVSSSRMLSKAPVAMCDTEVIDEGNGPRTMSVSARIYSLSKPPGAMSNERHFDSSGIGPRSKSVPSSSALAPPKSPGASINVALVDKTTGIGPRTKSVSEELSSSVSRRQADITRNVFYVVCAFLVCLTPYGIAILLPDTDAGIPWVMLLLQLNTCVNPVIYALKHPTFREVIPRIFRCDFANIPSQSAWLKKLRGR